MKKYNVMWEESHSVIIEANSEDEAIELVMDGQAITEKVEIIDSPSVCKVINKKIFDRRKTTPQQVVDEYNKINKKNYGNNRNS